MPVIEREWEWHFAASPEALWPLIADTARIGEANGFPRYTVIDTPRADGTVERIASARRFGMTITWDEGVPEWIAGKSYAHERRFHSRLIRRLASRILLDPEQGGTRLRYRTTIEAAWPVALPLRCGRDGAALGAGARPVAARPRGLPRPSLPPSLRGGAARRSRRRSEDRVAAQAKALAERGHRRRGAARRASARRARNRARTHAPTRAGAALAGGAALGDRNLPRGGARRAVDAALGLLVCPQCRAEPKSPRRASTSYRRARIARRAISTTGATSRAMSRSPSNPRRAVREHRRRRLLPREPPAGRTHQGPAAICAPGERASRRRAARRRLPRAHGGARAAAPNSPSSATSYRRSRSAPATRVLGAAGEPGEIVVRQ